MRLQLTLEPGAVFTVTHTSVGLTEEEAMAIMSGRAAQDRANFVFNTLLWESDLLRYRDFQGSA